MPAEKQFRVKLSVDDIHNLALGKVLYRNENGQAVGIGDTFTPGEHPIEIVMDTDAASGLRQVLQSETVMGINHDTDPLRQ